MHVINLESGSGSYYNIWGELRDDTQRFKGDPMNRNMKAILMAVLAAALFGLNAPISKVLLAEVPAAFMASLLYFGAGLGMLAVSLLKRAGKRERLEARITKKEMPYVVGMILLDVAAPICLMVGLSTAAPANASLLNNFEIVATSLIALAIFSRVHRQKNVDLNRSDHPVKHDPVLRGHRQLFIFDRFRFYPAGVRLLGL